MQKSGEGDFESEGTDLLRKRPKLTK
jgi:hypothetical protein